MVPRGPVAVPVMVEVPLPLLVTEPLAEEVPPRGPVTVALPVLPLAVLVVVAWPLTLRPRKPVADPDAVAVLPWRDTVPVAVLPRRPVTVRVRDAKAMGRVRVRARIVASVRACFMRTLLTGWHLYAGWYY